MIHKDIIIKESYIRKDFSDMVEHYIKEEKEELSLENSQHNSSLTAMQGWQCPICKRVYSPFTRMCLYCSSKEIPTITLPNTSTNLK